MKVKAKPAYNPEGHFSGSFDSKLKEAIAQTKGLSYSERLKLYMNIVGVCQQQTEDCCDGLTASIFLALHDEFGFGQKRITRLRDAAQEVADSYAEKYDVGVVYALKRALERRNIKIEERAKEGEG